MRLRSFGAAAIAAGLLLLSGWLTPAAAQIFYAAPSAPVNVSTATTTQIIAGVAGVPIKVVSYYLHAAAADNVTIEYGTGSSCSSPVVLDGPVDYGADDGAVVGNGSATVLFVPAGYSLCLVTSTTAQLGGHFTYWQVP